MSPARLVTANALLASLSRPCRQQLEAQLRPISLEFGAILYEPGETISQVYFPVTALVSLLTVVEGRMALEVGMIGWEGMVGIPLALGIKVSPVRALVQGAGIALRMSSTNFRKQFASVPAFQRSVSAFTYDLMQQISQTAGCNRFHVVDLRLARWLLMTRDRVGALEFRLTHEFLGHMLGVRREGVTQAAARLQDQGLIEYGRGILHILDEARLRAVACSCYQTLDPGKGRKTRSA